MFTQQQICSSLRYLCKIDQTCPDRRGRACCVCPARAQCDSADTAALTFPDATSYDLANTSANKTLTWLDSQGWHAIILPKKTACWCVCVGVQVSCLYVCVCEAREKDSKSACLCHHPLQVPVKPNSLMIDGSKSQ